MVVVALLNCSIICASNNGSLEIAEYMQILLTFIDRR